MQVILTKLNDSRHRFEVVRRDGSKESLELDTKSYLTHDLIHFAVEREAGLSQSFFGLLASGEKLAFLNARGMIDESYAPSSELDVTEMIVGPMTGVVLGRGKAIDMIDRAGAWLAAYEKRAPAWLDLGFVERVQAAMRALSGEWRAVPFGSRMTLEWSEGGEVQ